MICASRFTLSFWTALPESPAGFHVRMIQAKFKAAKENFPLCQFPGERQRRTAGQALRACGVCRATQISRNRNRPWVSRAHACLHATFRAM